MRFLIKKDVDAILGIVSILSMPVSAEKINSLLPFNPDISSIHMRITQGFG
jgi:hypothetical protein